MESSERRRYSIAEPGLERGFIQVPKWVYLDTSLSAMARFIYGLLLEFAWRNDSENEAEPTEEELAAAVGLSERRARDYVRELVTAGVVESIRRGQGKPNRYLISLQRPYQTGRNVRSRTDETSVPRAGGGDRAYKDQTEVANAPSPDDRKLPAVREPNVAFDTLAEVTGADSRARGAEIGQALAKITGFVRSELEEAGYPATEDREAERELVASRIRVQAEIYVRVMDEALLTPSALAKWWFDLTKIRERRGGRLGPEDAIALAREGQL